MYQTTKAKVVMTSIEVALNCKGIKICKYGHDSCTDSIKQVLAMGMYTWLSGLGGAILRGLVWTMRGAALNRNSYSEDV